VDFDLNEQQIMIRDLAVRFAGGRYDLLARARYRQEPEGFSRENWGMLAELGLLALPFDAENGGFGGGAVELITVMEEFGRALVTEPYLSDLLLGGKLLAATADSELRDAWLPRIIAGEARIALAHAEHAGRFNQTYVKTSASPRNGGVELSGTKTFVLAGGGADAYIVTARESGAPDSTDGLTLWLVAADAPGLDRHAYRLTDGSIACELRLHGVTQATRLDGGGAALLAAFDEARLAACAEMVGIMAMLFDATLEHVRTRKQFGVPIGSFQAIQHRMADLYLSLEQSRSQLLRAALLHSEGEPRTAAIAGAKSFIAASAVELGEECTQFHGGMGVTDELVIGHGHKRILLLASLLGDPESELMRYMRLVA
jgi:alkylation response protein AidB-like acyl-CoA dehydrogenase